MELSRRLACLLHLSPVETAAAAAATTTTMTKPSTTTPSSSLSNASEVFAVRASSETEPEDCYAALGAEVYVGGSSLEGR